ncbi:MAG: hypothetical protein H6618_05755 [Deltaproteobacteria bacterium]|nr:hypothetical protein [Deltaproteobacteria bacterium]
MHFSLTISFAAYKNRLRDSVNQPLTLRLMLLPFGVGSCPDVQDGIMTGLFLDALNREYNNHDQLDPLDVAHVACSLGFGPAQSFLNRVLSLPD